MKEIPTIPKEIIDSVLDLKAKAKKAGISTDDLVYCPYLPEWKGIWKETCIGEIAGIRVQFIVD